jgi:hypothetical protein
MVLHQHPPWRGLCGVCAALAASLACAQAPDLPREPERWRDGRYEWTVYSRAAAERPEDRSAQILSLFAPGVGFAALGLAAPPMFASGLVVGGLLIAPGAVILSGIERRQWERAVSPLVETDFPRALADALRARPIEQSGPAHEPLKVEVIVNGWGLHEERGRVCFTVSIDLVVRSMDRELLKDRLLIREGHGSPDAPPAQCASLERMGEQERWQEQVETSRRQLQAEVVDYLVRQKGYEARAVDLPPVQGEEAARALARSLDVDGLVLVQRYVAPPWTTGQAIGNVFLMNVPLVLALRAVNLRISIIEGRSGEVVWRRELKGQETERDTPADIPAALGDLDNAVPRRLR